MAVALALCNPEARRPLGIASRDRARAYEVQLRPSTLVAANDPAPESPQQARAPQRRGSEFEKPVTAKRNNSAVVETSPTLRQQAVVLAPPIPEIAAPTSSVAPAPPAAPTIVAESVTERPTIFIEASRETRLPHAPAVSLGPEIEGEVESAFPQNGNAPHSALASRLEEDAARERRQDSSRMETHLVHLQKQVDQIAQAQQTEQSQVLERATQLLDKIEQKNQLQNLERQLQQLQGADAKPPAPKPTEGEAPATAAKSEPVLKAEPSTGDGELLNLTIEDAEITDVLKMLGEMSGTNILVGANVKGKVTARLQNVNVEQALVGILRSLGFVFEREGRFIFVMTSADADARRKAGRKVITKVYRPNYISVADLQSLVTPLVTPQVGKIAITAPAEVGIKSSKEEAGGNKIAQQDALLVQDYAEVIKEVDNLIIEMDIPPMQVVIETMILNVKLDDSMEFGVNFALLSGNNKELFLNGNGRQLGTSSGFPGTGDAIVPAAGQFLADTAGLKFGFLRGDMSGFINAIESIADTSVLAAPQLRVINKQKAELIIGKQLSYTTSTFNQTQTIENVQFLDVGIKLILRPFISPDGMVRMEIHPERSSGGINAQTPSRQGNDRSHHERHGARRLDCCSRRFDRREVGRDGVARATVGCDSSRWKSLQEQKGNGQPQ
jgi:type IV pilus assembly protein PilQ